MSFLLLDAGNTRVKWAFAEGADLARTGAVAHVDAGWDERLADAWRGVAAPRSIWLANVATGAVLATLRERLATSFPGVPTHVVASAAVLGGVHSGYDEPLRLGVDRLLALAGAHAAGLAPAIVVGVGTATTIDALLADGRHRGGLILPSADAMRTAVVAGTQVRPAHAGEVHAFARSTEDALASGAWIALAATVERSATTLAREVGVTPMIVLHGGGAALLARILECKALVREHLVLEGLAAVARSAVR